MRILVAIFNYNEGRKLKDTLARHPRNRSYDLLVMDDGSNDQSLTAVTSDIILLQNKTHSGIGSAMKKVFDYALKKRYDVLVIQAGNNKDDPKEIPQLLLPIKENKADLVQGSRFLPGGSYGNIPLYRIIATRFIHPLLLSLATRKRITDSTNGFRAIKLTILKDKRIKWNQKWLDKYELEPYILYKAIKLGYRYQEVPVSKIYPPKSLGYTKMKPITGWWSILKPIFYLGLGIKD